MQLQNRTPCLSSAEASGDCFFTFKVHKARKTERRMTKIKKVRAGRHKVLYTEAKSSVDASVHTKETNTSISAYPLHILHVIPSKTNKKSLIIIWILVLLFISSPD